MQIKPIESIKEEDSQQAITLTDISSWAAISHDAQSQPTPSDRSISGARLFVNRAFGCDEDSGWDEDSDADIGDDLDIEIAVR
jgi:hypothetical protein